MDLSYLMGRVSSSFLVSFPFTSPQRCSPLWVLQEHLVIHEVFLTERWQSKHQVWPGLFSFFFSSKGRNRQKGAGFTRTEGTGFLIWGVSIGDSSMPSGGETGAREPLGHHRDCRLANNFLAVDLSMRFRFYPVYEPASDKYCLLVDQLYSPFRRASSSTS